MIDWLDEQLGRITMYRSVLYSLIILAGMALLLMVVGNLSYSPLGFIGAVTVSVGVAYASNHLFGWLFGVKPHSESALITGMILALLFIPPETVLDFVKLGLVAAIAMASKYVIALRGRHIFNPAAIAIVIASIAGLAYAGWWIATPGMIPVTLIVAALLLYRLKKLQIGLAFIAAAVVFLLMRGTDPVTALTSWPLLFVAGIMLTEPLTLPPRAWQQYAVVLLVAFLMTQPFHYGRITMTPALAIVAGNLVGWWFGQRRAVKLRFVDKKQLGQTTYDFTFDTQKLVFEPGQYLELSLPHSHIDSRGQRRMFSIVASPGDEQISIGTKIPEKPSSFKRALLNLKKGETLYATRVAGDFVLPDDPKTPIVCIAGGIGVTPFVAFCLSSNRPVHLIYSVNSLADLSFVDQLRQHPIKVTIVSEDSGKLPDPDWRHMKSKLTSESLKELIRIDEQPTVYISGPPTMVKNTRRIVHTLGIRRIKVDEFNGY